MEEEQEEKRQEEWHRYNDPIACPLDWLKTQFNDSAGKLIVRAIICTAFMAFFTWVLVFLLSGPDYDEPMEYIITIAAIVFVVGAFFVLLEEISDFRETRRKCYARFLDVASKEDVAKAKRIRITSLAGPLFFFVLVAAVVVVVIGLKNGWVK